jgi:hypothetical protein
MLLSPGICFDTYIIYQNYKTTNNIIIQDTIKNLPYLSRGNAINATITTKNINVCTKNPFVVGQPAEDAIVIIEPNSDWVSSYVLGFAIRKNTKAL